MTKQFIKNIVFLNIEREQGYHDIPPSKAVYEQPLPNKDQIITALQIEGKHKTNQLSSIYQPSASMI